MAFDSIFKTGLLQGHTVIVTGGGSGIGRCTAHELTALGARVILVGRKPEKLQKVAAEIAEDGGNAQWHACDIRDEEAVIPTLREHVPLKRIGTESEVSAAIVFLLSPAAAFISGSTLRIDGAASLGSRAWPLPKAQPPSAPFNGFHRAYLPDVLKAEQ